MISGNMIQVVFATIGLGLMVINSFAESEVVDSSKRLKPVPAVTPAVPDLQPLNLASEAAGASLLHMTQDGKRINLYTASDSSSGDISDGFISLDPANQLNLPPGKHEFLLIFEGLRNINKMTARLKGEGSSLHAYIAEAPYGLDSSRWRSLSESAGTGNTSTVKLEFPLSSALCVRLSVNVPNGGKVGSLAVTGDAYADPFSGSIPAPDTWDGSQERVEYDFARSLSGGRISYVESGSELEAINIVDNDLGSSHRFDAGDEDAFFIVELAEDYPVYKASIVTTEPMRGAEIWAFSNHPANYLAGIAHSGRSGELSIAKEQLGQRRPTGRVTVPDNEDETLLTMPLSDATARYMLVRVIGRAVSEPIEVSTFSVLGRVPKGVLPDLSLGGTRGVSSKPDAVVPEIVDLEEVVDPPLVQVVSP